MLLSVTSVTVKNQKPQCPSTEDWLNHKPVMKYNRAIKKKNVYLCELIIACQGV